MTVPSAEDQLTFLTKVQRTLDEGLFVATYKFALLMALADYAITKGNDSGDPVTIDASDIAESFMEYYWRQAAPYSHADASPSILRQSRGRQPVVLSQIIKAHRQANGSLANARKDTPTWRALKTSVTATIKQMPLWKLQIIGRTETPFLYEQYGQGSVISIKPGVIYNLRKFYELIRNLVQGAWTRHVRALNQQLLGHSLELDEFLFGAERSIIPGIRTILKDVQSNQCFYCGRPLHEGGDIDHFVPWSRYPLEFGHNFVLAHSRCNRSKRDYLAAINHLENWQKRNVCLGREMGRAFDDRGILHNLEATDKIAVWAYSQAEITGAHLWKSRGDITPIDSSWRQIMAVTEL